MKRRMKTGTPWVLVVFAVFLFALVGRADPIGPNCDTDGVGPDEDTCQGSIYTLLLFSTDLDAGTTDFLFRIDTSGYTGGGTFIDAVAIKVLSSMTGTTLLSAPGGVGNWTLVLSTLNASGCSGPPADPFACADDNVAGVGGHAPVKVGDGILEWIFRVPGTSGFLDTASVKARYVNNDGSKVGALFSEDIPIQRIPEPATLLLLGTGLAGVWWTKKKRS